MRMTAEKGCNGIVKRLLGENYCRWFEFCETPGEEDFYRISWEDGKVRIQGRNGVSMAAGLNLLSEAFLPCLSGTADDAESYA